MSDKLCELIDSALSEARDEALQKFIKNDRDYYTLIQKSSALSLELADSIVDGKKDLFSEYMELQDEMRSVEFDFFYRLGMHHCAKLFKFIDL